MKVLLLNGSCRKDGCTYTALSEIAKTLAEEGVDSEIFQIGAAPIRDCIGCGGCAGKGKCIFDDDLVNRFLEAAAEADAFVFGAPVYFAHPDGRIQCLLDRAFFAGRRNFEFKPCAVVTSARRAGTTASLDVIAKYPTIAQMPLVSSTYWNMVHGSSPEDVRRDDEGMQTMRNLARNMAYMLKCIAAGRAAGVRLPANEYGAKTNFIRG